MAYPKRRGVILVKGKEVHDRLIASIIKFLVQVYDANPLEIEMEKQLGKFSFDLSWKDFLIEAQTGIRLISKEKLEFLRQTDRKIIMCIPFVHGYTNVNFLTPFQRWADRIKEYWVFDTNDMRFVTKFKPSRGY